MIGPDLTAANRRFNRRDLLVSIIEPSKVIAENYRSLQIVTTDGKSYMGQATTAGDYRSPVLRLSTDPTQPLKTIEIAKNDIESQKFSDVSWMPEGLMDTFTKEEILDLIAYLEAGRVAVARLSTTECSGTDSMGKTEQRCQTSQYPVFKHE